MYPLLRLNLTDLPGQKHVSSNEVCSLDESLWLGAQV